MDDAFVARIAAVIEEMGGTNAAARKSGIAKSTLSQYKTGTAEPTRPQLIKLSKAAKVDLGWLASGAKPLELRDEHQLGLYRSSYSVSEIEPGSFVPQRLDTIEISNHLWPREHLNGDRLHPSNLYAFKVLMPDNVTGSSRPTIVVVEKLPKVSQDGPMILLLGSEMLFRFVVVVHSGLRLYAGRDMAQYTEELSSEEAQSIPFVGRVTWAAGPM